jgi:hypothetical protein
LASAFSEVSFSHSLEKVIDRSLISFQERGIRCYWDFKGIEFETDEEINGGWRMEDGEWRMEDGGWKTEDGGWKTEDGGWMENLCVLQFILLLKLHFVTLN